jgi:hypothetical protein
MPATVRFPRPSFDGVIKSVALVGNIDRRLAPESRQTIDANVNRQANGESGFKAPALV